MTTKQTDEQTKTVEEVRAELEATEAEIATVAESIETLTAAGETSMEALDAFGRTRNRLEMLEARAGTLRVAVLEVEAAELDAAAVATRAQCDDLGVQIEKAREAAESFVLENFAVYPQTTVPKLDLIEACLPVHELVLRQRQTAQQHTVAAKAARNFRRENGL